MFSMYYTTFQSNLFFPFKHSQYLYGCVLTEVTPEASTNNKAKSGKSVNKNKNKGNLNIIIFIKRVYNLKYCIEC